MDSHENNGYNRSMRSLQITNTEPLIKINPGSSVTLPKEHDATICIENPKKEAIGKN